MARKDILPLYLSKWNMEGGRKRETKKAKKKEREFSYGIEKGKMGFWKKDAIREEPFGGEIKQARRLLYLKTHAKSSKF